MGAHFGPGEPLGQEVVGEYGRPDVAPVIDAELDIDTRRGNFADRSRADGSRGWIGAQETDGVTRRRAIEFPPRLRERMHKMRLVEQGGLPHGGSGRQRGGKASHADRIGFGHVDQVALRLDTPRSEMLAVKPDDPPHAPPAERAGERAGAASPGPCPGERH